MPPVYNIEELDLKYSTEIIHIRSDQKVQCLPNKYISYYTQKSDPPKYICLFAVIFDDIDIHSNLVVYPRNQDGTPLTIYNNLVNAEEIERNNYYSDYQIHKILSDNDNRNRDKFIYYNDIDKSKSYLFVTVSETNSIVEVLSSTAFISRDNMELYPNPSTAQIFAIDKYEINLKFLTTQDLLLNIVGVSGEGYFHWGNENSEDKIYYMNQYNDRLTLTTKTDDENNKLAPLKVKSLTIDEQLKPGGFIFYITYYPRSYIDQLKAGRNTEINYRTVEMPLYYYAPITFGTSWYINLIYLIFGQK